LLSAAGLHKSNALQQAIDVSFLIKENRNLLTDSGKGQYLVRIPEQSGSVFYWRDEWLAPAPLERAKHEVPVPDELRLQGIKKKELRQGGIWEIDFCHVPVPIQEGNRPFFPLSLLIVDHASGFVLKGHFESKDRYRPEFQNQMLNVIEEITLLPMEIWVKREEVLNLFKPLVSRLGLKMKQVKRLKQLEYAQRSMDSFFRSGKMPQQLG
jgi:hypothetical protein